MPELIFSLFSIGLWLAVLICDLRLRRVPIPLTLLLLLISLIGQPWPWWALTVLMLAWPRSWAAWIMLPAAALGWLTNDPAPAIAATCGTIAWGSRWWGGADSLALLAMALRFGLAGLLSGALAVCTAGVLVMLKRRRSFDALLPVLQDMAQLRAVPAKIPADTELPAAAALAVAGIILEVGRTLIGLMAVS
ncbi:hypothetical protein ARNL5_00845 [Anaerolineae bacterium]|nr:hypothetical protein ARNL5_00845 [Anaerolineae bacterium]